MPQRFPAFTYLGFRTRLFGFGLAAWHPDPVGNVDGNIK
jgi:hypothetical protein